MWNRIFFIYLIVCTCILSLLSLPPACHEVWMYPVFLSASLTYPCFLVWMKPKAGFWKGAFQLLLIIAVALLCSFATYLLWYAYYEYQRLGNEFRLFEALGWTFDESLIWFIALEVKPAAAIAVVCYPIGYLVSRLLVWKLSKVEEN